MATLVIDKQGASVGLKSNRFVVSLGGEVVSGVPKMHITRVVVVGRATFSQQALDYFFAQSIPVCFISVTGNFKGFLHGGEGKNVALRMAQYSLFNDHSYRRETARAIVGQKVGNLRQFMIKYNIYHKNAEIVRTGGDMKNLLSRLVTANSLEEITGIEGAAAAAYFAGFGSIFEDKAFQFTKRTKRPPLDPVNAMLSLGYTCLLSEVVSAVYAAGLDPYLGFLHSPKYSRVSLACDIQEEFRFLIDELVIKLVNLRQIVPGHFAAVGNDRILLSEDGRKIFYRTYSEKIEDVANYHGKKVSYRGIIQQQAQKFAHSLLAGKIYVPYKRDG